MKFDMGRAWNDAVALLQANRDVVLIVGAAFFFLPSLALMLLSPDYAALASGAAVAPQPTDPSDAFDLALKQAGEVFDQIKWFLLASAIVQGIGMLGLLALLTDRARPTVGEALLIGAKCLIPYILAQILLSLVVALLLVIPVLAGTSGGAALAVLFGLGALVAFCYLMTKFSLVAPVIAIERVTNPLVALQRSWRLTKGNSVRLFAFYVLLLIAVMVISTVVGLFAGLFTALGGQTVGLIVSGLVNALFGMIVTVLFLAVLAGTHKQLARPTQAVSEIFE
ncbi:glycerophosphoryl diester phosphodiesterase membrane domain-containing protein [Croceibacterium sp. LX-88]|uniref:Glycerophosphoryl diester phosphodiesterase membrane domain-containing protein n=1 Tax=Croceibacterium selenioxidans TaxID=2838833 RepID=A0ABS5VZK3_9SPHN|nr:glycerophosphoryl diester phosphodiesterase membrane domain-containing protein [Croceibacterium selenioxidans]MBT2132936.1 glycerophosphoryl diester phosphodiesterase membrane domain-containing protein [Croceibacterium selenioxidans]